MYVMGNAIAIGKTLSVNESLALVLAIMWNCNDANN